MLVMLIRLIDGRVLELHGLRGVPRAYIREGSYVAGILSIWDLTLGLM